MRITRLGIILKYVSRSFAVLIFDIAKSLLQKLNIYIFLFNFANWIFKMGNEHHGGGEQIPPEIEDAIDREILKKFQLVSLE